MNAVKKAASRVARKAKASEPGARALIVYLLAALTTACMVREAWRTGEIASIGPCCDKLTGTAHAATPIHTP